MKISNFKLIAYILCVLSYKALSLDYNYDPLNRLTSATIDDSYVEYVYDKAGNLLETKTPYTISASVLGAGVVTDNLGKIDCGDDCQGVYNNNTSVTLTATPDAGNSFTGWSGACSGTGVCNINVTAQHTVQATFSGTSGNTAPIFTATGPFNVDENSPNGSFVGNVDANDGDGGATDAGVNYSITGGTGVNVFAINNSGVISVTNSSQLDYETTTSFSLTVDAFDGTAHTTATITVNLNNLPEITAPSITAPSSGSTITTATPLVQGTGQVGATVTVTGPQGQGCSALVAGNGSWSCSVSSDLSQGSNTLNASQVASGGQTSPITSVTFIVDTNTGSNCQYVVLSPNGGENWIAGSLHSIQWSVTGNSCSSSVSLSLYKNGSIEKTIVSDTANDGNYNWLIDNNQSTGSTFKVQVTDIIDSSFSAQSNTNFTISPTSLDTQLLNDVSQNHSMNETISQNGWKYFYIDITESTSALYIDLTNLTGDLDLYVRQGAKPTTTTYDCRPFKGSSTSENCTTASPTIGKWWIGINNFSTGAFDYKIKASWFDVNTLIFKDGFDPNVVATTNLLDGGFEGGIPNTAWTEYSNIFGTPLCSEFTCGQNSHTGLYYSWFGGTSSLENASLNQDAIIDSQNKYLKFWLRMTNTSNANGFLKVGIDGILLFEVTNTDNLKYSNYTLITIDISAFATGKSHNIFFQSRTEPATSGTLNFFVDDVEITNN